MRNERVDNILIDLFGCSTSELSNVSKFKVIIPPEEHVVGLADWDINSKRVSILDSPVIEQSVSRSRNRDLFVQGRFRRHVIAFEVRNEGVAQPGFQFVQPWKDRLLASAMKAMSVDGDRNPDRKNDESPAAPHDRFANHPADSHDQAAESARMDALTNAQMSASPTMPSHIGTIRKLGPPVPEGS